MRTGPFVRLERNIFPWIGAKSIADITAPQLLEPVQRIEKRCALRLAPLVFVRPGELRHAQWENIDFDTAEWRYIVTKTNTQHIVPLSQQAVEILQELKPLTENGRYVFPSARNPKGDKPMSDNPILAAMRRMGISKEEMSGHGFRAMVRTILDEE